MNPEFWKNRKVFVTGGTGLLGSWLVKKLLENKAEVVVLVRDWTPNSSLIRNGDINKVTVVRGDLSDSLALEAIIAENEIETIFHLAAQTIVGIANTSPLSTWDSNVRGTWNLLEACRRVNNVKQIVVASSDKAYGEKMNASYTEDDKLFGVNPYDCSKSCMDLISNSYGKTYKLPIAITRCGNLYGGGDMNWNRIIPYTIRSVINNEIPILRSDGSFTRDYFYVEDAVEAYMGLAEHMENSSIYGEAFNFSSEIQVTVLELVEKIIHLMGREIKPLISNRANHEIKHQHLSSDKAKKILGWESKYNLDDGLKYTIDWYKDFLK